MTNSKDSMLIRTVRDSAYALRGAANDYNTLMNLIGDARFVLLGEASHGTHKVILDPSGLTSRCSSRSLHRNHRSRRRIPFHVSQ